MTGCQLAGGKFKIHEPTYGYRNPETVERYSEIWGGLHETAGELDALVEAIPACYDQEDAIHDQLTPEMLGFEPNEQDVADLDQAFTRLNETLGFVRAIRQQIERRHF